MQKRISFFLCLALLLGLFSGCGAAPAANGDKLSVVTTIFPEYDWVRQIVGDKADAVDLTLLLDNGVDLHSYQPTADDMVKISTCELFIYVGGESDKWVDDALAEAVNKDMVVLNLLETLGGAVKEEELVEGMQDEDEDEGGGDEEDVEYDEHVWLSLRNVAALCEEIAAALGRLDTANADAYAANAAAYIEKLNALDRQYAAAVDAATVKTVLFGDRFPFRYLTDDYSLDYYAAFAGCSAETEASFDTIIFLAGKVDELGLNTVLTIESGDGKIARTIIENTTEKSAQILQMDSLQSTTARDVADGATYLGAMENNLEILKEALR